MFYVHASAGNLTLDTLQSLEMDFQALSSFQICSYETARCSIASKYDILQNAMAQNMVFNP